MEAGIVDSDYMISRSCIGEESFGSEGIVKQQKDQLEAVLENMSDAVLIVDKNGNYLMLNRTAKEILNPNPKNIRESYETFEFYDLSGKRLKIEDIPSSRIIKNESFTDKRFLIKIQSKQKYFGANGTIIQDSNGEHMMGVICLRDITHEVRKNSY